MPKELLWIPLGLYTDSPLTNIDVDPKVLRLAYQLLYFIADVPCLPKYLRLGTSHLSL